MKNVLFFLFFLSQIAAAQTPLLSLNADKGFNGTIWQDQSGSNNHVNLSAATTKTADGVYFNGNINAFLTKAIPLSNFTIYMTVKVETLDKTLFGTGIPGAYLFHYQTNALYTATAQPFTVFNSNKLILNQNAVIVFTRNVALNGNNIRMYLNGVLIGVFPGTQKTSFNVTNIAGETGFLFKGWIKNICVYNTVHTAAAIKLGPPCVTQTATGAEYLSVKGTSLTDICGNTVILRGVNVGAHNWGYGPLTSANEIAEIKKTGANAIRLAWYAQPQDGNQTLYTMPNLEGIINLCAQNQIVAIVELHDVTTKNDPIVFQNIVVNWWKRTDVVALIKNHEKHLIVNIANEYGYCLWAGNSVQSKDAFENTYKNAISQLRTAGIRVPIMIDAPDGGNSHEFFIERGQNLLASDPMKNLIFSVHAYWSRFKYNFDANNNVTTTKPNYLSNVQTQVQNIKNTNLCFIIGEVANQQDGNSMCQYDITDVYKTVLTTAQNNNMSWLAWMWHYDSCANRQMSNNRTATNLSVFGSDIVNNAVYGLKAKAKPIKISCP